MATISEAVRKAWREKPGASVNVLVRVEGDLAERAATLEERGYRVQRTLRLAHRLALRCTADKALQLSRFRWISDIEPDQPMRLFGG
jgi:hypothetical protein